MKYIRTKDGRIIDTTIFAVKREIFENKELLFYEFWTTKFVDRQVICIGVDEIISQADTIEELCDVIVIFQPPLFKPYIIDDTFEYVKRYYSNFHNWKEFIVRGAIWTDKGLIYVAKMNENGELKLL